MYAFGTISLWHVCAISVLLKEWRAEAKAVAAQEKKRVEEVGWVQSLDITGETEHSHHNCHNSSLFSLCCTMIMRLLPETCTTQSFLGRISISDEWKWYQNKTCTTADLGIWLRLLWTNGPSWTQFWRLREVVKMDEAELDEEARVESQAEPGSTWEQPGATDISCPLLALAGIRTKNSWKRRSFGLSLGGGPLEIRNQPQADMTILKKTALTSHDGARSNIWKLWKWSWRVSRETLDWVPRLESYGPGKKATTMAVWAPLQPQRRNFGGRVELKIS